MASEERNRRASDRNGTNFHDLLIRIDENVKNLKEDFAEHKGDFKQHKIDDEDDFRKVRKELEPLKNFNLKVIGGGTALIFVMQLLFKLWK